MDVRISERIRVYTDSNCFMLCLDDMEIPYKSFDLLLCRVVREELSNDEIVTIGDLKKRLDDLHSLVYGLYTVSGMYPEIKMKTRKYTGVGYGQDI